MKGLKLVNKHENKLGGWFGLYLARNPKARKLMLTGKIGEALNGFSLYDMYLSQQGRDTWPRTPTP